MLPARTFSISIRQEWQAVYERIWHPDSFAKWASGLAESDLRKEGDQWLATGPDGPIRIRFTPYNGFGVMDHFVDAGSGEEIHIPLRVIQNGDGAEVLLTLFRQPDMDDELRGGHQMAQPRPQGVEGLDRKLSRLGEIQIASARLQGQEWRSALDQVEMIGLAVGKIPEICAVR